jgi:hypothetical protein
MTGPTGIFNSITQGPVTFNGAITAGVIFEPINTLVPTPASGTVTSFTLNYATNGSIYAFDNTSNTMSTNVQLNVTNLPSSRTNVYTFSIVIYNALSSNRSYINSVNFTDTTPTVFANGAPLFSGGTPSLGAPNTAACMVVQTFSVVNVNTTRYVVSSVTVSS